MTTEIYKLVKPIQANLFSIVRIAKESRFIEYFVAEVILLAYRKIWYTGTANLAQLAALDLDLRV